NGKSVNAGVYPCSTLNACVHSFCRNPGMHQRMHSGSIARAASAAPRSSTSQPKVSHTPRTISFAASPFPQMNMVGLPSLKDGFTIRAWPTELNALTKRELGAHLHVCLLVV